MTVRTICPFCFHAHEWGWEEAFDKFGFDDGDGLVMTGAVVDVLAAAGYEAKSEPWGIHNIVITAITRDGVPLIPESVRLGYDHPRKYLPTELIALLDGAFPDGSEVAP